MDPEARAKMIDSMVSGLAEKLKQNPDDLDGWRMLARSYRQLEQYKDWLDALTQVRRLAPDDFEAQRDHAYAMWLVGSDQGSPSPETVAELEALLKRNPDDPVALLALATAAEAGGDKERAENLLSSLSENKSAPPVLREEASRRLEILLGRAEDDASEPAGTPKQDGPK
jgi:cytochrome c-type biogenesis protein CcmH